MEFYLLVALSIVLGSGVVVALYWITQYVIQPWPDSTEKEQSSKAKDSKSIPRWDQTPTDTEKGDLEELANYGSLHQYLLHLHDHGNQPITSFCWGKQRVVSICSSELFKDTVKLTNRPKLLFTLFEPMLGPLSIQYANDQDWEERRQWLYKSLRDEHLRTYIPIFIKIANETAAIWTDHGSDSPVELQEEFMTMTIKGITRTCYGSMFNDDKEIRKLADIYHKLWLEMENSLHVGFPEAGSPREKLINDYCEEMRSKIREVVEYRKETQDSESVPFIDSLLQSGVPEEQIISDGITFMVGGFHTSGYLLVWTMHYLMLNQDVFQSLIEEMRERVGDDQGEKLTKYVYDTDTCLRQVLNETLRVSVLAPYAARYSDNDISVGGYPIPAGTPIIIALGVSLRNKNIWRNVDKFDHSQCSSSQGIKDPVAFAPFGHGQRKCPGYLFSYIEVSVFFTILMQQFKFEPAPGFKEAEKVHGLVTSPREPLQCYISRN